MSGPASGAGVLSGRYVLRELVARGGMGEVFRATATGADGFEKAVAIKRILPSRSTRADAVEMFVREAKLMTTLSHPNVVDVLDFGKAEDGSHFLVLEWIDGLDLGRFLAASPAPTSLDLTWTIGRELLRGLAYAHGRANAGDGPLVHRDVSPANVLLSREGEVKIADFGVATAGDEDGAVVGKPGYMAPEQIRGEAVDARADLFAAAVVIFHVLTKASPFRGDGAPERLAAAVRGDHVALRELRADAPEALDAFFARGLAPAAGDRFQSAKEMSAALDEALRGAAIVASADELAAAVEVAQASVAAKPRAPIVLGRALATSATKVTRHDDARGGERTEFTIVAPDEPARAPTQGDVDAPLLAPSPTSVEPPAGGGRRWLAGALMLGVAAAVGVGLVASDRAATTDASSQPTKGAPSSDASARPHEETPPPATPAPPSAVLTSSASAPVPLPSAGPRVATTDVPRPADTSTAATAAAPCTGTVVFAASHAWVVTGGPSRVEAPGRYTWACGSYGLTATSRLDATKRAAAAVVKEGATARVDLR